MALRTTSDPVVTTTSDSSVAGSVPGEPAGLSPIGLAALLVGVFLPMTDFFIVNVALPTINRDLHASAGMLQLVVSGYAISYALLLVVGGRLGDAIGRRRLFLLGMAGFTVTSAACGLAPNIELLVVARVLQGAASAMLLPQVLSTIQATSTGPRRSRALARYGATGGMAAVAGQLLGGLLVAANIAGTGWRPIFLVNVPVGILGLIAGRRFVPETRSQDPLPVDVPGTALLAATLLFLLVPLTEGRTLGWPLWTIVMLALSPVAAWAFVRTERRLEDGGRVPLVPLSIVRVRSMRKGLIIGVPFFAGFASFMFVYALGLQDGAGLTALQAGVATVPMALGFLAASLSTSRLLARFGRSVMTVGGVLQALGVGGVILALSATWPHPSLWALAPGMLVAGVGQGLVMVPLFGLVLSEVPARKAGVGSGVLATMQQTSLGLGVATLGSAYLILSPVDRLGVLDAMIGVLAVIIAVAIGVAIMSRSLPNPAAVASEPTSTVGGDAVPTVVPEAVA